MNIYRQKVEGIKCSVGTFFERIQKKFSKKNFTPFQPLFSGKTVCLCCPHFQQKSSDLIFLLSFLSLASSKKLSRAGLPDFLDKIYQNGESVTKLHKRFQIAIKLEQMATKYTWQMVIKDIKIFQWLPKFTKIGGVW
jgi:hypothetical protein